METTYLDHSATTPIEPRVADEIHRVSLELPGNPSSPHAAGREARRCLEEARERIAALLGAEAGEIHFTSGGTESDNLAVLGGLRARRDRGRHLVITRVEHPGVLRAAERAEEAGTEVTRLAVDSDGLPDPESFRKVLRPDTALASVMLGNSETGAIFPVAEMAEAARARGVPVHTDAVQAVGKIPVRVEDLGIDMLTAAAHKFGGPKGVGVLYIRSGVVVLPVLAGGHQERGVRPGTVPVALAAGMALAMEISMENLEAEALRLGGLTDRLLSGTEEAIADVSLNGPRELRLPGILNLRFRDVGGEALLIALDREGFQVSTGSACTSGSALPSHVLSAMGLTAAEVSSSIRVSLGRTTTERDVDRLLERLPLLVARLRAVSRRAG